MSLQRGEILGYDFNRMVVEFTMLNQGHTVRCAISTAAMDDLEGKRDVKADQRVDQFVRLRDAIVNSSKGQSKLKDPWCCDLTISSSSCLFGHLTPGCLVRLGGTRSLASPAAALAPRAGQATAAHRVKPIPISQ